jgi:cyclase
MASKSFPLQLRATALLAAAATAVVSGGAAAGGLHLEPLGGSVNVVRAGEGSNVTFSAGSDGLFFVGSGTRRDAGEILELAEDLGQGEPMYLVNADLQAGQTGGNARFAKAGAVIVAHESVRRALAALSQDSEAGLPVLTLSELGRVNFDFNDETIEVVHLRPAHSPANLVVHFADSNVIHAGELFSPDHYPTITGGSIDGFVSALDTVVKMADHETVVVPARGPVSDREGLIAYREMLIAVRERVTAALDQGQTFEQFAASKPTREFDPQYGDPSDPLFLPVIYEAMRLRRQPAGQ